MIFLRASKKQVGNTFDSSFYKLMERIGYTDLQGTATKGDIDLALRDLFFRCLDIRASSFARSVVGTFSHDGFNVERAIGGKFKTVEQDHRWVKLIKSPSSSISAYDIWYWASMMRDINGVADFVVEDDGFGVPIALYPIYPEFGELRTVPDQKGGILAYEFFKSGGGQTRLETRDVVRIRLPHPYSPYQNASLLRAAMLSRETSEYHNKFMAQSAKSGRRPPVALVSKTPMNEGRMKMYADEFNRKYYARDEIKGVPVLGDEMAIQKLPISAADIDLIGSMNFNAKNTFQVWGVPEGLLSDDANRANAEAAQFTYATMTIQPIVDHCASQLTRHFTESFRVQGNVLRVVAPDVTPINRMEEAQLHAVQIGNGTLLPNEIRERKGMTKLKGGDDPLINTNLKLLNEVENA